ncbi:MAG: dUTP diphosphatase [Oscillospiraceae bacterium]
MADTLKVKLMRDGARLPFRASSGAAACDLFAYVDGDMTIAPGEFVRIPTGIAIELPRTDLVALVFSRSGQGLRHGVSLVNSVGVIDSDFRGEIEVGIINHGALPYTVSHGDRIAQLMITNALPLFFEECAELSETERGEGGLGSTGR